VTPAGASGAAAPGGRDRARAPLRDLALARAHALDDAAAADLMVTLARAAAAGQ
jgi:hypothetical protein